MTLAARDYFLIDTLDVKVAANQSLLVGYFVQSLNLESPRDEFSGSDALETGLFEANISNSSGAEEADVGGRVMLHGAHGTTWPLHEGVRLSVWTRRSFRGRDKLILRPQSEKLA